jgi:hypothetical protein
VKAAEAAKTARTPETHEATAHAPKAAAVAHEAAAQVAAAEVAHAAPAAQAPVQVAMAEAPVVSDVSVVPNPSDLIPTDSVATIEVTNTVSIATGPKFNENLAVKAVWDTYTATNAPQRANTGYDFWFYNPNGGYSHIRQRRHNASDGYGTGALRACHMRVNAWTTNQIPNNVPLNVRVRSVINGVAGNWGAACRFERNDALALCPPIQLNNIPGNQYYSCNVFRNFTSAAANRLYTTAVSGATKYKFTFVNSEATIVREVSTYYLNLGWAASIAAPLTPGSTYGVSVQAFKNGAYCVAGPICAVTINPTVSGGQQNSALESDATDASLSLWPNPNNGEQLYVSLSSIAPEVNTVSMEVYDLSGKRMITRTIAAQDGMLNTVVDINGEISAGMYLVRFTAGEQVYTRNLVVQP